MKAMSYQESTIKTYSSFVASAMEYFETSRLVRIDNDSLYQFAATMNSDASKHQFWNSLKCYFKLVEGNQTKIGKINRPKKHEKPPIIYSPSQIKEVIDSVDNLKHKTILYILYGTGVRLSELINLKWTDVNRSRNCIRVVEGKGGHDRETVCDNGLISILEEYWKSYKTQQYILEGAEGSLYSRSSAYNVVKNSFSKNKLKASPHTLRHCFATHLIEANVNLRKIQKMMGHKRIQTLEIYSKLVSIDTESPISYIS